MQPIDRVRKFFTSSEENEGRIIKVLQSFFDKIRSKKSGSMIGRAKAIDYQAIMDQANFPANMSSEDEVIEKISALYEGVGVWVDPQMQVNVIPPPTDISIVAACLAARYNENSIWDQYGMSASQSEVMAIGMLADLIGFDKARAGGIFTFGGTGCNLYAARIGIEKADPDAKYTGIRDRIHFYASDVSHYSVKSAAIWTGIGLDNVKIIPSDDNNVMNISALEEALNNTIDTGARIGTIFATMGTTDAFGIDPLKKIIELRDNIKNKVPYNIHVHADAVIGWPYLTFRGDEKIQHLPHPLKEEIMCIVSQLSDLYLADSVGVDFHKTGWAPYLCSAFIVKDQSDTLLLQKTKKDMPYLYHGDGYQPGTFTLESSRPNYAQKALVNMMLLGREGYEILISHLLTIADYFRSKVEESKDIALLNRYNPAFVTDFRIYPQIKYEHDGKSFFDVFNKELHDNISSSFTEQVNEYNKKIAQRMVDIGRQEGRSIISYTDSYKTTNEKRTLVSLKSYPMSPFIDRQHIDKLLFDIYQAKDWVDRNC